MNKVLVIAPHADDETFGCGGTILRMLDYHIEVKVIVVVHGKTKFHHLGEREIEWYEREEEFNSVMEHLGVKDRGQILVGLDSKLDSIPIATIINPLETIQKEFQADTWLIPGPSFHQDHDTVYKAAIAAGRPFTDFAPKNIACYELPTYVYGPKHMTFYPNLFIDIEPYLKKKIEAVNLYKSQLRPPNSLLSTSKLKSWAETRGGQAGLKAAEAFEIVKSVW